MNEMISSILNALKKFPLTFEYAFSERNNRGEEILVFSCKELPLRDFIYVPGGKNITLGWDTVRCPLSPEIRDEFHQYYLDDLNYHRERCEDEIGYYREKLAGGLSEETRQEYEGYLREAEENLQKQLSQTWEDYLQKLLEELDACTSPLRKADISPMLAERWAWNTPEEIEPPFALPTEDEWEYLCSGGVHTLFPWGDTLELEPIYNEELDKDTKNAFGLVIGYDCRAEQVADANWLKGDDGGTALCGGEGDRAAFGYVPYYRYGLYYYCVQSLGRPPENYRYHRRRILRLTSPGT